MLKLAMFDAKPYDRPAFERYAVEQDMDLKFFEAQLTEDTVSLAAGFDAVIPFVNDIVNARVIDALHRGGMIRWVQCMRENGALVTTGLLYAPLLADEEKAGEMK